MTEPMTTTPTSNRLRSRTGLWLIVVGAAILVVGILYGLVESSVRVESAFAHVEEMTSPTPLDAEVGVQAARTALVVGLAVALVGAVLLGWGLVLVVRDRSADDSRSRDWSADSSPRT